MKRRWLITLALLIIVPLLAATIHLRPRTVPLDECSELYRHYADSPDIRAAYIKDYRLNDTLTICATILEAVTDSAWDSLAATFGLMPDDPSFRETLDEGKDILTLIKTTESHPYTNDIDIGVASRRDKYICFFHPDNSGTREAILGAVIRLMAKKIKTEQKLTEK